MCLGFSPSLADILCVQAYETPSASFEQCILPDKLTGFRMRKRTTDAPGALSSALEDVKLYQNMVHRAFFDLRHAFDYLPHATILHQLRPYHVQGRLSVFRIFSKGHISVWQSMR